MAVVWQDKKRILGMPISFTRYILEEDRLILDEGLIKSVENEIMLYRIQDITLIRTLGAKIFGVGTLEIRSSDKTHPVLLMKNIKNASSVKRTLSGYVERERERRRVGTHEFIGDETFEEET
ncbi:MAG: PH domain-containing protein [Clostridia bacterium]|nr:PH domain-containing protein [Clostridia bacterium]MBQ2433156.1 PH domain-containing protein [Clostridia bacterium]